MSDLSTQNVSAFTEGMLDVGEGHRIYWRGTGSPEAPAVVILHGGPGGAMNLRWGEFFDPTRWRLIFFDQRECGRSTPFGELRHNGLANLVADMEKLRQMLGIERWALFGGSWGTTLALAYAAEFPHRCLGFLLRGVFLARRRDLDWFLWDVRRIFQEAHARFLDAIEQASGNRPTGPADILRLTEAPLARLDAKGAALAQAWSNYENALSAVGPMLEPGAARAEDAAGETGVVAAESRIAGQAFPLDAPLAANTIPTQAATGAEDPASTQASAPERARPHAAAISMALLERHYIAQELPPAPLLPLLPRFAHLPCYIVHGRFDMVCLAEQAYELARAWPRAHLSLVNAAGHWTFEPGIAAALRRDSTRLRGDLGN